MTSLSDAIQETVAYFQHVAETLFTQADNFFSTNELASNVTYQAGNAYLEQAADLNQAYQTPARDWGEHTTPLGQWIDETTGYGDVASYGDAPGDAAGADANYCVPSY